MRQGDPRTGTGSGGFFIRRQEGGVLHRLLSLPRRRELRIEDCVPELIEKLREADGFIVASPVYFGTARGDVMAALQRIGLVSMSNEKFLSWMVGGPIAVARRGGHTATVQEMLMFFLINEMIVPGSSYWNMVFGFEPGEVMQDEEGMNTVRLFSRNVARLITLLPGKD